MATDFYWDDGAAGDQLWASNNWSRPNRSILTLTSGDPGELTISAMDAAEFAEGVKFRIIGSLNEGEYTVASSSFDSGIATVITVEEVVSGDPSGIAVLQPVWPGDTGSTVADTITIISATPPTDGGPTVELTVASYICSGSILWITNLFVSETIILGEDGGVDAPVWGGTAIQDCTALFQGAAVNQGFVEFATFNDSSYNGETGTVGTEATFNTDVTQYGTFTGYTYYIQANTTFDPTCIFVDGASFSLLQPAVLTGTFTDGMNAISIGVVIDNNAIAHLSAANILLGKTILGVPGEFNEAARNVDPGIANVRKDTVYKSLSPTNKTGTLDIAADNPDPDLVLEAAGGNYHDPANSEVLFGAAVGVSPRTGTIPLNAVTTQHGGTISNADLMKGVVSDGMTPTGKIRLSDIIADAENYVNAKQ